MAAPARVISLVLSDVVGDPLDAIASGPTVPDPTTWADSAAIVDRYDLWDALPMTVVARLREGLGGQLPDTPKLLENSEALIVGSNLMACHAAVAEAERRGLRSLVLSSFVEGEAREVGRLLAAILREVDASSNPLPRPCLIVAGGETTVTVRGNGTGGRNQELALGAAAALAGVPDILLMSIGTDGSDGPTDAAGAFVDGTTIERAAARGLDVSRALAQNDSYSFFNALGDLVRTGPTRTNVNDLYLLFAF
jgi:glycerate 2-kinase